MSIDKGRMWYYRLRKAGEGASAEQLASLSGAQRRVYDAVLKLGPDARQDNVAQLTGIGYSISPFISQIEVKLGARTAAAGSRAIDNTDVVKLTMWLVANRAKVHEALTIEQCAQRMRSDLGLARVSKTGLLSIANELKVKFVDVSPVSSDTAKMLAKHIINLYTELGAAVPDDLWALAGGTEEQEGEV